MWSGGDPARIVGTFLDVLLEVLRLDLVYVRLNDPVGDAPVEVRVAAWRAHAIAPRAVNEALEQCLGHDPRQWPPVARNMLGGVDTSLATLHLGLQGEVGVIVAGSGRADFPLQTETLILSVAAIQAVIGLQEARRLSQQRRLAHDLDQRVAQRTLELAAANAELRKEVIERRLVEERLRAEEEALSKAQAELAHVARVTSLGALTASIAHEVSQPLSGIITNANACLRMLAAVPPNLEGAVETVRRTVRDGHRASEVITRLRALFGKHTELSESVDLNEATREVIALSRRELQRGGVLLRSELADDLPPVAGDRVQLQQVTLNLLLNAAEAMSGVQGRPRQLIVRTLREEGDRVRLSVQDTGLGFAAQSAEKLFEAFYTTKRSGMGIGLFVSRTIIENHHGRLWGAPNEGPGATFAFSTR